MLVKKKEKHDLAVSQDHVLILINKWLNDPRLTEEHRTLLLSKLKLYKLKLKNSKI